jgi:hypothetical protein
MDRDMDSLSSRWVMECLAWQGWRVRDMIRQSCIGGRRVMGICRWGSRVVMVGEGEDIERDEGYKVEHGEGKGRRGENVCICH